jgi:type IV pilus assembly protein PilV
VTDARGNVMAATRVRHSSRRQHGVGLVEVLISIVVLSIGLLGAAALQATSLRNNHSAMQRSVATILAYSMIDAMRANDGAAPASYNTGYCATGGAGLAAADIAAWQAQIRASIGPSACGSIDCDGNTCTVAIRWDDTHASGGTDDTRVRVQVRL